MMRCLCLAFFLSIFASVHGDSEEATPGLFHGGASTISSRDPECAAEAVAKWSSPEAWEQDLDPTGEPWFWDFSKVGRRVFLRVLKRSNSKGNLEVWLENPENRTFEFYKAYRVSYFSGELGPKMERGDQQAPEGFYFINRGRMNPHSSFHLSMDIGYPNAYDQFHGRTGDLLMIHGKSVSLGCFAMTDSSIEQIYTLVDAALRNGQQIVRVHCFPFAMNETQMNRHKDSEHIEFWENLREGWDWFEEHRVPPNVTVEDGRYVFSKSR